MRVPNKSSAPFSGLFAWIPLLPFVFITLMVGVAGYTIFARYKQTIEQNEAMNLAAIADLKVAQVSIWRNALARRAESFMRGAIVSEVFEKWLHEGARPNRDRQRILNVMNGLLQTQGYRDVLLLDLQGRGRITTRENDAPDAEETRLALEAMRDRKLLFQDIHWNRTDQRLEFNFIVPLLVTDEKGSRVVGAMEFVVVPDSFLFPLIQSWPTSSRSAETLLVRREGDDVVFINPLRHKKLAPLSLRIPISTPKLPPAKWLRGEKNLDGSLDYRGVPVVAIVREIPGTPWIMVAKIDRSELFAPVLALQRWAVLLSLLFIAGAGVLIVAWRRERHARTQYIRSNQEYAAIIQTSNDGFLIVGAHDGRFLDANETYSRMTGYSREELLGMRTADIEALETPEQVDRHNQEIRDAGRDLFETRHRCKDGRIVDVEVSTQCLDLRGGVFVVFIRDITARKAAEQTILRLSQLYLGLSRANEAIARIHDRDALLREICDIAVGYGQFRLAWVGLLDDETQDVEIVAASGEAQAYLDNLAISADADKPEGRGPTGIAVRGRKMVVCNDFFSDPVTQPWKERARSHGLYASASCPLIHDGRVIGALTLYAGEKDRFDQDMTNLLADLCLNINLALGNIVREKKRVEAEQAVREGRRFLYQVIDADPSVIFVKDAGGRLLLANRAFAAKLGKMPRDLVGTPAAGLFPNQAQYEPYLELERRVVETRRKAKAVIPLDLNGNREWWLVIKSPMVQPDETVNVLCISVDITEQKLAEEKLGASYRELEKLTARLELVREDEQKRIARELHDEMGAVLAALHINVALLAQDIPAEMKQLGAYAETLSRLVENGIQAMRNTVASLRPSLLEEAGLKLTLEQYVRNFQLTTGTECELRLPEGEIMLGETRSSAIFRIVQESLSNVAKYAAASKVTITLSDWDESLVLTVRDNGKGFDPSVRKAGSFGLVGIRERAALAGGVADISSAPGRGTSVRVTLPLCAPPG